MNKLITIIICLGSFYASIHGQILIEPSLISSAGGYGNDGDISISWTLGEIAVSTLTSEGLVLSQGFHQGNLIIDAIEGIHPDFQLKTYPNPVLNKLIIESSDLNQLYEIIDVNGRVLYNGIIDSNPFELDFTNLPSGAYFLRVEQKLTHKIIKR